jgi:hypothetical protein
MIDVVTIGFCSVGLLGCVVFGVAYHRRTRGAWWRAHEIGRMLMAMNAVLASILLLILTTRLLGDWPGRRLLVVGLTGVYMLHPWWWLRVLYHAYQKPNRSKGE